jgi:hypothetical protein
VVNHVIYKMCWIINPWFLRWPKSLFIYLLVFICLFHYILYYSSLGSISTLTKWIIIFFQQMNFFNLDIIFFSIFYYNIVMSSEFMHSVAYDNYYDFQHVNFVFSQYFDSLFWGLFNDKIDLKVRYYVKFSTIFLHEYAILKAFQVL